MMDKFVNKDKNFRPVTRGVGAGGRPPPPHVGKKGKKVLFVSQVKEIKVFEHAMKLKSFRLIIVATRCHIIRLKCIKFDFGWGSAPDPAGELTALPIPSSWILGALLLRGEGIVRIGSNWYRGVVSGGYSICSLKQFLAKMYRFATTQNVIDGQTDARRHSVPKAPLRSTKNRQTRPRSSAGSRPPIPKFSGYVEVEAHYILL